MTRLIYPIEGLGACFAFFPQDKLCFMEHLVWV